MLPPEWMQSFQMKAQDLKHGDTWKLEYDENIEPKNPNMDWKEYIRNTSARFKCSVCRRQWPSNRVMVIFHMCLRNGQGTVKVRLLRQNCKMCSNAPMENPRVDSDNINILMEKLVEKIKQKCYYENLDEVNRQFKSLEVKSPHEPKHCEGCIKGVCTNNQ
ncbi:receptor-transporting protein 3-like [Archocentrus centrarchus]|uniref:receptor-transporting protein 3-like n=1 Tax=Archocentrus centrarchus TaxID=63155 RepID=UPI0011E9CE72|nr:receptor-transporting protein 3-like [Archocentrus centrarchus]